MEPIVNYKNELSEIMGYEFLQLFISKGLKLNSMKKSLQLFSKFVFFTPIAVWCTFSCSNSHQQLTNKIAPIEAPFEMPQLQLPIFKTDTFNILDFGAVADGSTKNTQAFQKTIKACSENHGGVVLVPSGKWFTGPIHLKSNINFHITKGAEIIFSSDTADYTPLVFSRWEGTGLYNFSPLIYANGEKHIAITGKGSLNGQGQEWTKKYVRMPWRNNPESSLERLRAMGEQQVPVEKRRFGWMKDDILYPSFVHLINCKNILLEDFTINKGPYWTVHPTYSENIIIRNIRVETYGQANGDGINPDACKNVLIENCVLNTGDDAITLKSGRDLEGRIRGKATENVVIRYCKAEKGHGGVAIGSEMSGGVKNVYVHDCEFASPLWGFHIKSMRGRGNVVENIWFENITMGNIRKAAIKVSMHYHETEPEPLSERTPSIRKIYFNNIDCEFAPVAIIMEGLEEKSIENITFSNITCRSNIGIQCSFADSIRFIKNDISVKSEPLASFVDCHEISFDSLINTSNYDTIFAVARAERKDFAFKNMNDSEISKVFFLGN